MTKLSGSRAKFDAGALRTLDNIPVGILKSDLKRTIVYANKEMTRLVGGTKLEGTNLMDYLPDQKSRDRVQAELKKRFEGLEASEYEVNMARPGDGKRIPVAVSGAPAFDANGKLVGAMAFVRDLRIERAQAAMHRAIEGGKGRDDILKAVATQVRKLIPHDCFRVVAVSQNRKHLRPLYVFPDKLGVKDSYQWWPMPPHVLEFIRTAKRRNIDVEAFFKQSGFWEQAQKDPGTVYWLEQGFKHILSRPVMRGKEIAAFVGLETRDTSPYTREQLEIFDQLPVVEAVLMSLQLEQHDQHRLAIDLIQEMGNVSENIVQVAKVLVGRLQRHYSWDHVSVFRVDEDSKSFRLVAQSSVADSELPSDFNLPFGVGLLGRAHATQRAVNVGDVTKLSRSGSQPAYFEGIPRTRSEMCILMPGTKLRWILNVESSKTDAFADVEQASVELLTKEAGLILERAALLELKTAILQSVEDGVLQTDASGCIHEANDSAARLFEAHNPSALVGKRLNHFIVEPEIATAIIKGTRFPRMELELRTIEGKSFPALLSASDMPPDLGGKVFVVSDLTYQKRLEESDNLKQVFRQVAMETRTPLALVSSWIQRALSGAGDSTELMEKSMRQLRKMDMTLDRVLRIASAVATHDAPASSVDVNLLVKDLVTQLPEPDAKAIAVETEPGLPTVVAEQQDLEFCVSSILGFLLRSKAQEDWITVACRSEYQNVILEMSSKAQDGSAPLTQGGSSDGKHGQLAFDIALGESVIRQTLDRMGGDLRSSGKASYSIHLKAH